MKSTTNPTLADLAALAERLEKGAAGLESMLKDSCIAPDLRMAARCVRAWAALEGMAHGGWRINEQRHALDSGLLGGHDTALAAVEEVPNG